MSGYPLEGQGRQKIPDVTVTKVDAARRQLAEAIRMFFCRQDELATHTVACAAAQIVSDLLQKKSGVGILRNSSYIRPEKQKEVAAAIRAPENFLKHADRDAGDSLKFNPEITPHMIFAAIGEFMMLTDSDFPEARLFGHWFIAKNPNVVNQEYRESLEAQRGDQGIDWEDWESLCRVCSDLRASQ